MKLNMFLINFRGYKHMYWLSQLNQVIKIHSDPHHVNDLDLIILYFVFYTLVFYFVFYTLGSEIVKSDFIQRYILLK